MKKLPSTPWYCHRWPWILMAGPFVVVVAGIVTTWLAISSADGLVEDDYYKQGLAVNQRIERDHEAERLGLTGQVMLGGDGRQLRLVLASGRPDFVAPKIVALTLSHPTRAGLDQKIQLALGEGGVYSASLERPVAGRWNVAVQDTESRWRLVGRWNTDRDQAFRVLPGSGAGKA